MELEANRLWNNLFLYRINLKIFLTLLSILLIQLVMKKTMLKGIILFLKYFYS